VILLRYALLLLVLAPWRRRFRGWLLRLSEPGSEKQERKGSYDDARQFHTTPFSDSRRLTARNDELLKAPSLQHPRKLYSYSSRISIGHWVWEAVHGEIISRTLARDRRRC